MKYFKAQIELKGTYEVKFYNTYFEVYDENDNLIYYENSDKFWAKREIDGNGNQIYFEDSDGYWYKQEFDDNSNLIYYESSSGYIIDSRPKKKVVIELTQEQLDKVNKILKGE